MYERSAKGVRYQLYALNMWVAALVVTFGMFFIMESFFGFVLAFLIFSLAVVGLVFFILGTIQLVLGGKEVRNTSYVVTSLLLLILAPFVVLGGVFNIPPMNYIIIHIGIWMLFTSLVLPYWKLGGAIPGAIAVVCHTVLLIYTLVTVLTNSESLNMPIFLGLLGAYFLFLEFSILVSYLKIKNLQAEVELIEGEGRGDIELGPREKVMPRPEKELASGRSERISFDVRETQRTEEGPAPAFKVLEYEFSGSAKEKAPETDQFRGAPTKPPPEREPPKRKGPVTGRVLKFEEVLKRVEAAEQRKKARTDTDEKFTVEEEEEIDLSYEDLYIEGQTLYEILKVPRTASAMDIKKAYRKKALLYHPDRNVQMGPLYSETIGMEMRKINTAKDILLDSGKRQLYDRLLDTLG
ncbi:MAG: DnaJ domain-containing protein [Thermoplasmatota archaeon]